MLIVAISDTHRRHDQLEIPPGDVLVHAGDFCGHGSADEMLAFAEWFEAQPHPNKIVIAGNHDRICERDPDAAREAFKNVTYLFDSGCTIDGVSFWGSPWQPWFMDWAFNLQRGEELAKVWAKIPDEIDVLITHGPPYGHGGMAAGFGADDPRQVGCMDLLARVAEVRPKLHIFGHIHEGYGITRSDAIQPTRFVNASICTREYEPTNSPVVVLI